MMSWFGWCLIGLWTLGAITTITTIGKPRKPMTPRSAAISVIIIATMIVCLILFGTGGGVL